MGPHVDLTDVAAVEVGVELRRGDVGVAEKLLDDAQVGASLEHVRREAVAQRVRVQPLDPHDSAGLGHERVNALA